MSAVLFLLRDQPTSREDQARAFKAFLTAVGDRPMHLRVLDGGLEIGGQPISPAMPGATELASHLRGHGVYSIRLGSGMVPPDVLSVLRALAAPVGRFPTLEHLVADIDPTARGYVHLGAEGADVDLEPSQQTPGFVAGEAMLSTAELHGEGRLSRQQLHLVERPAPERLDAMLTTLAEAPGAAEAGALLDHAVAAADAAMQAKDYDAVIRVAASLGRIETELPEGEVKRSFQLALRRMLSYGVVEQVARRTAGAFRQDAIEVLKRAGAEASDVLLQQLVESDSMEERRAYYNALRQVATASPLLGRLLSRDEWFVIRNVAELCGELRAEDTVPQLARHATHEDERVRRAVAAALAKIGTGATIEPLRQLLRDPSPQVRLQAVQGLDGSRSRALAMSLSLAAEEESNSDVLRELLQALGRIGTAEAVQALARTAAPGRRLFNRRPVQARLAAIDALRVTGSAAAASVLQGLLGDDEEEVRGAAERALSSMVAR